MLYGILKTSTNTGLDSELQYVFSTPLSVTNNAPSFVQEGMNLKVKASSQNLQRWEIDAEIAPENGTANALLHTVEKGHSSIFYVRMPQPANMALTAAAATLTADAGINTDTLSVSIDLIPGEFINIGADPKVYLVLSSASGSVRVHPRLKASSTSGAVIKTGGNVTMLARYSPDVKLGISFTDGVLSSPGTVRFSEAI